MIWAKQSYNTQQVQRRGHDSSQTQLGSPPKFHYGTESWAATRRAADTEYSLSKVAGAGV